MNKKESGRLQALIETVVEHFIVTSTIMLGKTLDECQGMSCQSQNIDLSVFKERTKVHLRMKTSYWKDLFFYNVLLKSFLFYNFQEISAENHGMP